MKSLDIYCGHCGSEITVLPCVYCGWRGFRAFLRRCFR